MLKVQGPGLLCRNAFRVPPWPIYRFGVWLLGSLHTAKRSLEPPPTTIFDMVRGSWRSQVHTSVTNQDRSHRSLRTLDNDSTAT